MNPLTQIKNQQKATQREIAAGFSESASWHAKFRHSAYIFVGGLPYTLTEGDVLAVFSQYGEVVDVNLVRRACALKVFKGVFCGASCMHSMLRIQA